MVKKIFLGISIVLTIWLGRSFFDEYLYMHKYYAQMLTNPTTLRITIIGVLCALLPTAYLIFTKNKSWWGILTTVFFGLFFFAASHISIKTDLYGGIVSLFISFLFLFLLAIYMFVGFEILGTYVYRFITGRTPKNIFDVCINLGVGLVVFLLLIYVLVIANIFYSAVSWLIFIGFGVLMRLYEDILKNIWGIIQATLVGLTVEFHHGRYALFALPFFGLGIVGSMYEASLGTNISLFVGCALLIGYIRVASQKNDWGIKESISVKGISHMFMCVLLILTFWYLFQGFQLAYLPYPTAWDANHAYMFYPKMWALHGGYYWNEINMTAGTQLWPMFIAYFFSLFQGFDSFLGASADTIAIEMNFWSGVLFLLFGLGCVSEVIKFLAQKAKITNPYTHKIIFSLGWLMLLLWLTSGMGAFLVFIDNKTDMGVLALITLALYSGFSFINALATNASKTAGKTQVMHLLVISGFLYGAAVLAKPTALFDVLNFGLFLWMMWFGWVGVLGAIFLILGGMTGINFRGIKSYIPQSLSMFMILPGIVGVGYDVVRVALKRSWTYARYLLLWSSVLLGTIILVKLPFKLIDTISYDRSYTPGSFIQSLLLGSTQGSDNANHVLLAQAGNASLGGSCTLASQGFSASEDLYKNLQSAPGDVYNEDVGRYIGFGWKGNEETDARRGIIPLIEPLWAFWMTPGCYGANVFAPSYGKAAKVICEQEVGLNTLELSVLQQIVTQIPEHILQKEVSVKSLLDEIIIGLSTGDTADKLVRYRPQLQSLQAFMQENTIKVVVEDDMQKVYVPYKYLAPSNISFNWSLQNLSSYYTDIGVVWLYMLYFIVIGFLYGVITRKKPLIALSVVTLFGWGIWWLIGGSIFWYAIGLVIRTILAFIAYVWSLIHKNDDILEEALSITFVIVIILFAGTQMVLNMVRISSQGGGGAFLWYKTGHGPTETIAENLQPATSIDRSFGADDVFDMQFRHYKKYLSLANASNADEGSLIAGTYIRYFVEDQTNIQYDQFLTELWEKFSDNDPCNSYLRLKDQKLKYLVIDPNIGTVVQGAGNQSLFDRFFARVDTSSNTIVDHGVMTMLMKLYTEGYISYVSSNNLGAKYALILPDSAFTGMTGDDLILQRARMSIARFFPSSPTVANTILQIAEQRVQDGTFVTDIADVLGLEVREDILLGVIAKGQMSPQDIVDLTQDERKAMSQYLSIRSTGVNDPNAMRTQLQGIIKQSIGGGNQLIVVEVNE